MSTENVFVRDAAFVIRKKKRTAEGFLDVWGVSAKVGPLDYPAQRRRVWVPATVLADTSTITDSVLVNEHPNTPTGAIDPRTARMYSVGHVAEAVFDPTTGEQVVRVRIIDAQTIADVESGKRAELSPGYDVGLVPVSAAYPEAIAAGCTHVQVFRRVNHLAVTETGRGGPTVRLYAEDSMLLQAPTTDGMLPAQPQSAPTQMPLPAPMPAPAPMQMPLPAPMPAPAPAAMPPMPAPAPAAALPPAPKPMTMDEWQKAMDALTAQKPAEAAAPAPAEPPKPSEPPAFDSMLVQRVSNATLAAAKLGVPLAGLTTVEAMELAVARKFVGDSVVAEPMPGYFAGLCQAALVTADAKPAEAPKAPVNTAMSLAFKGTAADATKALSFEESIRAKYKNAGS